MALEPRQTFWLGGTVLTGNLNDNLHHGLFIPQLQVFLATLIGPTKVSRLCLER